MICGMKMRDTRRDGLRCGWVVGALAVAAISVAGLPGCAASVKQPYDAAAEDAAVFSALVGELAAPEMEGRGPGTAGLEKARDLIVARFAAAGLGPVVQSHGEGNTALAQGSDRGNIRGYTQPFTIDLGAQAREQSLALTIGGGSPKDAAGEFNAMGFSGDGAFSGPLVFAGYGIVDEARKYDSYRAAGERVKGAAVVVFRYEPMDEKGRSAWAGGGASGGRSHEDGGTSMGPWSEAATLTAKAKWAAERGAAALLVVNPLSQDTSGGGAGSLRSTETTVGTAQPIPVLHITTGVFKQWLTAIGAEGEATLREYERRANTGDGSVDAAQGVGVLQGLTAQGRVEIVRPQTTVHNVIGVLPGAGDLAGQVVVIGAHYDHLGYGEVGSLLPAAERGRVIHAGADDNASGTAGLVMLAERFARRVKQSSAPTSRRTLLFVAFSGEERGLLGSSHMVKNLGELGLAGERIVAMVNMDMIGRLEGDRLMVPGVSSGDRWVELLRRAAAGSGLKLQMDDKRIPGASDHLIFQMQRIPAAAFFTGVHADYHKPSDTAEKINAPGAVRVLGVVEGLIRLLWTQPTPPAFTGQAMSGHAMASAGHGAFLGIVPDYQSLHGSEGVLLSGAVPGSPAEQAGLQQGDRIVRWNERRIENIYTLTEVLAASKPGDTVKLGVKREDKLLYLTATLRQR